MLAFDQSANDKCINGGRMFRLNRAISAIFLSGVSIYCAAPAPAMAQEAVTTSSGSEQDGDVRDQNFAIHAQETIVVQANANFHSPYEGQNSLNPKAHAKETFDLTLYAGLRPWRGAEIWVDPELDQGFGLSDTLGIAGFPSGEAYKVGKYRPYAKLHRWFLRQTINLGGSSEKVDPDLIKLGGRQRSNRIVLTIGKFSVVDVFDTNDLAHDPRGDFFNWGVIDAATFDYAANAWGYTYGAAAEAYVGRWALRGGVFDLSKEPNGIELDPGFHEYELNGEIEERHSIVGQPGSLKFTFFLNHGRMGRFDDAIALASQTGLAPDIAAVRRYRNRAGASFNFQQQISNSVSLFAKGGIANGNVEPYEFIDVDRSIVGGVSIKGKGWKREDDTLGIAAMTNAISAVHQRYLALGGLGILVGDGKLPHPGPEQILEVYYDVALAKALHLTFDGQFINHPAYNRDRGPVPIGAVRIHAQF